MSILNVLKKITIFPFCRRIPTIKVGNVDSWNIVDPGTKQIFVISAGVGKNISFEQDLATRWNAKIILLDPTPTGSQTMLENTVSESIEYLSIGLSDKDGVARFSKPQREEEGSFSLSATEDVEAICLEVRSLKSILEMNNRNYIDILKMDIEGFEYPVIANMLTQEIRPAQICLEIHTKHGSGVNASLSDAFWLILRLYMAGYRIIFNNAMDFTFCDVRKISSANEINSKYVVK